MTIPRLSLSLALLLPMAAPGALAAQARGSESTLIFGIAAGVTGSERLWSVPAQAVGSRIPADTVGITRDLDAGVGLAIYGIYFPKSAIGLSGEVFFVGNSYDDSCENVFTAGIDSTVYYACRVIDGSSRSSTSLIATAGVMARAFPRRAISPYVRLSGGFSYTSRSSTRLATQDISIYNTKAGSSVHPSLIAGLGFSARSGGGDIQIRMEFRDALVAYSTITGPAPNGSVAPPTETRYHHLISLLLGVDIVLEKSRGRRY
jgi:hypothetical protein